jgi:hypothetical protein
MAKRIKHKPRHSVGGPYLSVALFCDQILEEKDGTLSAIRIVDTVTLKIPESTPDDQAIPIGVWMLLVLKSGDSPGEHEIRVDMRSPTGKVKRGSSQKWTLSPQSYGGINLRLNTTIMVKKGGVFWADAYLDGKPISHTPLNVTVERVPDDAQPSLNANGERPIKTKKSRKPNPG